MRHLPHWVSTSRGEAEVAGPRSGAGGHLPVALGCAWPRGSPLPSHPSPRPGALPLGRSLWEIFTTLRFGCSHRPITAVTLPSAVNGQETWRGCPHLVAPPDSPIPCASQPAHVACRNQELHPDGGAQGSQVGKKAEAQVKGNSAPCAVAGGSFCPSSAVPRGWSLAFPSPRQTQPPGKPDGDGEPGMERDHGTFSLMQCYEYSGSFCSLFNGFECEKVVELGRGEERGGGQASLFRGAAPALDLFSIWRALGSFSPPQPLQRLAPFFASCLLA